jgi:hypothetical protein
MAASDGSEAEGVFSLSPGKTFKVQPAKGILRNLTLAQVASLRFHPTREEMVQKWRFPEAGKTRKEKWGDPYPMRHLACTLRLTSGEEVKGHLYTTVLHLQRDDTVEKVILRAKQRGKPGETLTDLTYPLGIEFAARDQAPAGHLLFTPALPAKTGVTILPRFNLMRTALRRDKQNRFPLPPGMEGPLFLGLQQGETLTVGWTGENDPALTARVRKSLESARDFFDEKELLGLHLDREQDNLYTLMLLSRGRRTTLKAKVSLPWRLEIWRWKGANDPGGKLMLAGRGFFFRGIRSPGDPLPTVALDPALMLNAVNARVKRIDEKR